MNTKLYRKLLLLSLVCFLSALPLLVVKNSEFGGVDDLSSQLVHNLDPGYVQWISNLWSPPGSETESLLFSIQATIGGGVIGYIFGTLKERYRKNAK